MCQGEFLKDMWRLLETTHEGTNHVKWSKMNILMHSFELFYMKNNESIVEMITRFTDIINALQASGKIYRETKKVMKILRSFLKKWNKKSL